MSEQGQDFRDYKDAMLEEADVWFGKYKGKRILECNDPRYWRWVWDKKELYSKLGKYQKKAVRIAAQEQ